MKTVDALLFDLGGVLIDVDFARVTNHWARAANVDAAALSRRFVIDENFCRFERGEITPADFFAGLRETLQIELGNEQFLAGWNAIFSGEMPGSTALISQLAGEIPLFIFSNTNTAHEQYWAREHAPLLQNFDKIFVSSTIGLRKPDAAAFDHVVKEIGVRADRIAFFDDLRANVDAARACGLQAAHVPNAGDLRQALTALQITPNAR